MAWVEDISETCFTQYRLLLLHRKHVETVLALYDRQGMLSPHFDGTETFALEDTKGSLHHG